LLTASAIATSAWASVATEQQQGAQTIGAVHAGKLKGTSLSNSAYEHVGEYLMGQALGSTRDHERMNSQMGKIMGPSSADQMHIYLGERYFGKSAQISGRDAPMYGLIGMMTSYRGSSIAGMMSGYLSGSHHSTSSPAIGSGMMGSEGQGQHGSDAGWTTGAIIATTVLATLLLGALLAIAVRVRRGARGPRGRGADAPVH